MSLPLCLRVIDVYFFLLALTGQACHAMLAETARHLLLYMCALEHCVQAYRSWPEWGFAFLILIFSPTVIPQAV